jgi:hypothetical protein
LRAIAAGLAIAALPCALSAQGAGSATVVQQGGRSTPAAPSADPRVHPELADSTWGPRMRSAWSAAWAGRWHDAEAAFSALHDEQPDAMEPYVGLGFIARAGMRYDAARQYFAEALAREPAASDVRRQALALRWDRPGSAELRVGAAAPPGGAPSALASINVVAPLTPSLSLLLRAGSFGFDDPRELSGPRVDTGTTSRRAQVLGGGAILHPTASLWITPRLEWWSTPEGGLFGWIEGAYKPVGRRFAILGGARPISGHGRSPQVGGGAEVMSEDGSSVLTLYGMHGLRADTLESRDLLRAILTHSTSAAMTYQLATSAELGSPFAATTVSAGVVYLTSPRLGVRTEIASRMGAVPRNSLCTALVVRW